MKLPKMNKALKLFCKYRVNFRQRWVLAFMCFLGLFHAHAMRACLSITLTEMVMVNKPEVKFDDSCPLNTIENVTYPGARVRSKEIYSWNEETQGIILSSFYWGYVVTHLPGGLISEKYGGKHIYGLGIFLTSVFTLLTPLSVIWAESTGLITVRILMGLGEGVTYPAISFLLAQWIPPHERSRTGTFVYAAQQLGLIYANTMSGLILHHTNNWQSVFYISGGVSALWYIFWLILCYNNPKEHPFISESELNYLNEQLGSYTSEKPPPIPWRHVLKSKPIWATSIAMIGFNWSNLTIVTDLPKYLSSVLKFSVQDNGYFNSLVNLSMWIGSVIISCLADFLITRKYLSITNVRKAGSVLTLLCSACFVVAASYVGCDQLLVIVMFFIAMGLMGAAYPSIVVNTLDISPNYSGTLMALSNGISAGAGIISPYIIGIMTPNQTLSEWRMVFWILFIISVAANLVFLLFGKGEIEYWNDPNFRTANISKPKVNNEPSNISNTVL